MSERYAVARVADIPEGGRLIVEVEGRSIGLFRVGGRYYALLNRCPHMGAELCRGEVLGRLEADVPGRYRYDPERKLLACPWHGWEFDLATGQSYVDPARTRVRPYGVSVETGELVAREVEEGRSTLAGDLVKGPYMAETYPVSIEDDYLLLTMTPSR